MLKKTIAFVDFDGVPQTETHYFNLTKAEIIEMELNEIKSEPDGSNPVGGFRARLTAISKSGDGRTIMAAFKEIIKQAYGVRSEDGRRFIKSEQISDEFLQTAAYSVFFEEIVTNAENASAFINGLAPANLSDPTAPAARADGRPALSDHLPKQVSEKTEELRVVNEPVEEITKVDVDLLAQATPITAAQDEGYQAYLRSLEPTEK